MTRRLDAPPGLWESIREDLLSTPHLERAGVGFAGISEHGSTRRLLLRDWVPVPPDEYLVQLGYHLEVSPAFWARHAKRARQSGEALVVLHSHPMDQGRPRFSPSDDGGEARLIPKIHARATVLVAALVVSPGGHEARITAPGAAAMPLELRVVGQPGTRSGAPRSQRFDRQIRLLGREGQAILAGLTVGVVGAGGLGSHVIQQLIHLGVGRILIMDPDRVARSNLSRLVGASRWDVILHRRKTAVAEALARRVGGPINVVPIAGSVTEGPARRLLDCDVVAGCTDNQWSRTVMNAIADQYYIPVLDLRVELQARGAMGGRATWLTPGSACLWCCKVLDPQRVRAEQLPRETLANEVNRGYVEGLDEHAAAVVSINGVVASLAVTEILARTTGFTGPQSRPSVLMYRLADGDVRRISALPDPTCPTCSTTGQLGLADLASPPWTDALPAGAGRRPRTTSRTPGFSKIGWAIREGGDRVAETTAPSAALLGRLAVEVLRKAGRHRLPRSARASKPLGRSRRTNGPHHGRKGRGRSSPTACAGLSWICGAEGSSNGRHRGRGGSPTRSRNGSLDVSVGRAILRPNECSAGQNRGVSRYRGVLMSRGYRDIVQTMPEEGDRGGDPQTDRAAKPRKVPIAFPEDMYEWLREEAFKRHGAMADIVREAVNEYRERSVQQMRLPMKSDR